MMMGNYFGMGYQPSFYPMNGAMPDHLAQLRNQQLQPQSVPQCGNGIIWVLGEAEAKGYPVAPGSTVILWDKDNPTIFVKSADASGIPSLRILDWKERQQAPSPSNSPQEPTLVPMTDYVTRKEFEQLAAKIEAISKEEGNADG